MTKVRLLAGTALLALFAATAVATELKPEPAKQTQPSTNSPSEPAKAPATGKTRAEVRAEVLKAQAAGIHLSQGNRSGG